MEVVKGITKGTSSLADHDQFVDWVYDSSTGKSVLRSIGSEGGIDYVPSS